MDHTKIGQLIRRLRREQGLTQRQLAEEMGISDKTVSKWERGMGCPDLSLLPELSDIFHVGLDQLLTGELEAREALGGDMKKDRSNQKLTKADYEKFAYHDTRFYGLFYTHEHTYLPNDLLFCLRS